MSGPLWATSWDNILNMKKSKLVWLYASGIYKWFSKKVKVGRIHIFMYTYIFIQPMTIPLSEIQRRKSREMFMPWREVGDYIIESRGWITIKWLFETLNKLLYIWWKYTKGPTNKKMKTLVCFITWVEYMDKHIQTMTILTFRLVLRFMC